MCSSHGVVTEYFGDGVLFLFRQGLGPETYGSNHAELQLDEGLSGGESEKYRIFRQQKARMPPVMVPTLPVEAVKILRSVAEIIQ